jgi:hypothetical protein
LQAIDQAREELELLVVTAALARLGLGIDDLIESSHAHDRVVQRVVPCSGGRSDHLEELQIETEVRLERLTGDVLNGTQDEGAGLLGLEQPCEQRGVRFGASFYVRLRVDARGIRAGRAGERRMDG